MAEEKENMAPDRANSSTGPRTTRDGQTSGVAVYLLIVLILAAATGAIYIKYVTVDEPGVNQSPGPAGVPVPGNPELTVVSLAALYENGTRVTLTENRNAADPVYGQLVSFLQDDPTEHGVYEPGHICSSFAAELHDSAEKSRIRARVVIVFFNDHAPHTIVAFNTTDQGTIYVDDTGATQEEISKGRLVSDMVADVTPGRPYARHFLPPFHSLPAETPMGIVDRVEYLS